MTIASFLIRGLAGLALIGTLSACTVSALRDQVLQQKAPDTVVNNLYVAADTLKTRADSRLNERTVIAITPFRDKTGETSHAPFGSYAAGIIAERFAQLGFSVSDERAMMTAPGSVQRPASLPVTHVPASGRITQARVEGEYHVLAHTIQMAVQLVDATRGTILGQTDVTVNRTDAVNEQLGRTWGSIIRNSFNLGDPPPPPQPVGQAGGATPSFEEIEPLPIPRPTQSAPAVKSSSPPVVEAVPLLR